MHWDWYDEDAKKEIEQALALSFEAGVKSASKSDAFLEKMHIAENEGAKALIDMLENDWATLQKKPNAVDIGMLEHNAYHDGYREGKNDGAKAERERIYALLAKLRNGRFVYNDEMKLAIDMIKDEIKK